MDQSIPRPRQIHRLHTFPGISRVFQEVTSDEDLGTLTPLGTRPAPIQINGDDPTFYAARGIPYNPDDPEDTERPLLPFNLTQTTKSPPPPPPGAGNAIHPGWKRGGEYSRLESLVYDDTSPTGFYSQKLYLHGSNAIQSPPSSSLLTPTSLGPYPFSPGSPKKPRQYSFSQGCEPLRYRDLAVHVALCGLAYPFLLAFVIAAAGKTLFWARVIVGVGSGLLGLVLGASLIELARRMLEAATWATIIHQSRVANCPGVRLKDLAAQSGDPYSILRALRLLWDRYSYPGANRSYRKAYDSRPWTLVILFFMANIVLSGGLTFAFGRIVDISVQVLHQQEMYYEVAVKGDLTEVDVQRATALGSAFDDLILTWTLAPFSSHGSLPAVVSFPWNDEPVYFSEVVISQLLPNGSGFGTFETAPTVPSIDPSPSQTVRSVPSIGVEVSSVLRFPRWGIRIKCAKITDPVNIVPLSNNHSFTYLYTPRDTLRTLFDGFNMSFPTLLEKELNASDPKVLASGDKLPDNLDLTSIAIAAMFWDNGVAHSTFSTPLNLGDDGTGFVTVENILVRLNTTYAPNGTFSTRRSDSLPDQTGKPTFIAYDAAVCLELYEPWVLEVYNSSSGLPNSLRIVDKAATVKDMNTRVLTERLIGDRLTDPGVKRQLNSTGSSAVYIAGHQNSVNQMLKDNGRDAFYIPSPTLVSFTGGQGPYGYTQLSAELYGKARALADGNNVLPYFAGSGSTLARSYPDSVITQTVISNVGMAITIAAALLMGMISAFFVPKLPMGAPRRGFDLYSWMSAFHSHELIAEGKTRIDKDMELEEIVERVGELRFRHVGS